MLKPDSLRAALTAAIPDLATEPARLQMIVDSGGIRATAVPGLAFEYRYTLQLLLLDFAGHPDMVFVPLLAWLFVNQNDVLANSGEQPHGLSFEAELLDSARVDLQIRLKLSESCSVAARSDGGYDVTHWPEPVIDPPFDGVPVPPDAVLWHLFLGGDQILEWTAPGIVTRPYLG